MILPLCQAEQREVDQQLHRQNGVPYADELHAIKGHAVDYIEPPTSGGGHFHDWWGVRSSSGRSGMSAMRWWVGALEL